MYAWSSKTGVLRTLRSNPLLDFNHFRYRLPEGTIDDVLIENEEASAGLLTHRQTDTHPDRQTDRHTHTDMTDFMIVAHLQMVVILVVSGGQITPTCQKSVPPPMWSAQIRCMLSFSGLLLSPRYHGGAAGNSREIIIDGYNRFLSNLAKHIFGVLISLHCSVPRSCLGAISIVMFVTLVLK